MRSVNKINVARGGSTFLVFLSVLSLSDALEDPRAVFNITVLPTQKSLLAEAPYYDANRRCLYYVDSFRGEFIELDLVSDTETKVYIGGTVTIMIPYSDNPKQFIISSDNKLYKLDWDAQQAGFIAEINSDKGDESFNDGKCDARGRLIIGSSVVNVGGVVPNASSVYRLDGNVLIKLVEGISVSNGMAWSNDPDHKTFYLNDFGKRIIYQFDYNISDGTLSNQKELVVCESNPDFVALEYPDGMAIDKFGFIWVAMYGGGRIVRINPSTARVVDEVKFPRANSPTSLAFGDYKGEYGFFVTSGLNLLDGGRIHFVSFQGGKIQNFNPNL